jgi:hypothetical protein
LPRLLQQNARLDFEVQRLQFMANDTLTAASETRQQRFERILSQARFEGLKAIFERTSTDREALYGGILGTNTYEQLLARLGHKLVLTRQIHVQDSYSRLGPEGGIKAVLPYYDIPTQSSLPTLVNLDSSVTTTPKAVAFFDALLGELKKQLNAQV